MVSDSIADLIAQARTYDLERDKMFDLASPEAIDQEYNGIGPEWLPESIRQWMTSEFGYFAAAAMIHDWDYACYPYRDAKGFWLVNERLRKNCHKLLAKGCPWWKRPLYAIRANALSDACQKFGWSAWQQAVK